MKKNEDTINSYLNNPQEGNARELISVAKSKDFTEENIVHLATGLANSGKYFRTSNKKMVYDIPSTGGPSSLSTLLCPLILSLYDKKIIKLAVPGRPAGGIDVLAQINGYKYTFSYEELYELIYNKDAKYVHFLANEIFTPLDIRLFNFRKQTNSVGVSNLVIASILSKKIALGVNRVGLDIRVSEFGNFGRSMEEAVFNAKKFNSVACKAGIESKCFITNGTLPQQPFIGRGESLLALRYIFEQKNIFSLHKHFHDCIRMSLSLIGKNNLSDKNIAADIESEFKKNIQIQSGDFDSFRSITNKIQEKHIYKISSPDDGILSVDLLILREAICSVQNSVSNVPFPDPCGIILKSSPGDFISKGDIIATFRCETEYKEIFYEKIKKAFTVNNNNTDSNIIII